MSSDRDNLLKVFRGYQNIWLFFNYFLYLYNMVVCKKSNLKKETSLQGAKEYHKKNYYYKKMLNIINQKCRSVY